MPKSSFIRSNWKNNISDVLINMGIRIGGGAGASYIAKKVNEGTSQTLKNIINPGILIASAFGDMVLENGNLRALCQGMGVVSALKAVNVIAPEFGRTIGLSGIEDDAALMGQVGEVASLPAGTPEEFNTVANTVQNDGNDWQAVADQIDEENSIEQSNTNYNEIGEIVEDEVEAATIF